MAQNHQSPPWKQNLLKVPKAILDNLSVIKSELVIVAATKEIPISAIDQGVYAHLGITLENGAIAAPASLLPMQESGKFSARNVLGWEVTRKDLPMITKTYSWETPNFGDASTYGTHTHYVDRLVYQ